MSQKTEQLAKYFDARAPEYDAMLKQVHYRIPAWVSARGERLRAGAQVLDLGCGNGVLGRLLKAQQPDLQLDGVDLSPVMVEAARAAGQYRSVTEHDISLGLPDSVREAGPRYDVILAFGVLEFLEDPSQLLDQAAATLQPEGRMWISFEKTEATSDESGGLRKELGFRMYHHELDAVTAQLTRAGLKAVAVETLPAYQRTYDQKQITWWVLDIALTTGT